jgi:hypothetical protein
MYVPALMKVRLTLAPALLPGMSAGAPATASKYTLCATEPKSKVIVPPWAIVTGEGLNVIAGVAFTVAVMAGGGGAVTVPTALPPHADKSARKVKAYGRDIIGSSGKVVFAPSLHRPD